LEKSEIQDRRADLPVGESAVGVVWGVQLQCLQGGELQQTSAAGGPGHQPAAALFARPLWNYESSFIEASLKSELAADMLSALLVVSKDKLVAGFSRDEAGSIAPISTIPADISTYSGHDLVYDDSGQKTTVARLLVHTSDAAIQAHLRQQLITTVWQIVVLDICIIALLMVLMHRNVLRPLNQMNQAVFDLAQGDGDLTQRLKINRQDEMGTLAININHFIAKLQEMVAEINELSVGFCKRQSGVTICLPIPEVVAMLSNPNWIRLQRLSPR